MERKRFMNLVLALSSLVVVLYDILREGRLSILGIISLIYLIAYVSLSTYFRTITPPYF